MSRRKSRRRAADHVTHTYKFRRTSLRVHLVNGGCFYEIRGDNSLTDLVEREIAASELAIHFGCSHEEAYARLWSKAAPCRVPLVREVSAAAGG